MDYSIKFIIILTHINVLVSLTLMSDCDMSDMIWINFINQSLHEATLS